jgi:hypothetical protein
MEEFKDSIHNMLDDAEAVTDRRDMRANIAMAFFIIAALVMFLLVLPFVGAGVYVAGKDPR